MDSAANGRAFVGHAVAARVLDFMRDQVDNAALSDISVHAGTKSFRCHRAVLAASSPVFAAMFTAQMLETTSGEVKLDDVSPDVFIAVRDYMYGRPLQVRDDLAIPLSAFVRRFDIGGTELSEFLDSLLTSALTLDNVLHIRDHADAHSAHRLRRNCDRFIATRMNILPKTPSFLASPAPLAVEALRAPSYVSRDALSRKCAQYVLAAALAWLAHDLPSRHEYVDMLLNTVDVNSLSLPALVRASRESIAMESQPFQARLLRAFAQKAERDLNFGPPPRPPLSASDVSSPASAGFAIVDDHGIIGRGDGGLEMFPYSRTGGSLYPIRRRSSLANTWRIHSRFPRREPSLPSFSPPHSFSPPSDDQ